MKQKLLLFFSALLIFAIKSYGQITTIDCNMPPLTIDYCYDNENTTLFTYVSNNGLPLRLTINSGEVEDGYDDLIVYDSDGITNINGAPFGNDGDITGMVFQSTGDSIGLLVYSDSSISCTSGSFPEGINYTVSCATCVNPTVSYQMIPDCENGDQFYIDTQIASFGDADSLTISNSINEESLQVFSTGTYQIGPFNIGESVVVSISNDQDDNCVVNSNIFTLENCPPPNDNPCNAIVVNVNESDCSMAASGTIFQATASSVPTGSCAGNPDDDVWYKFTALYETQVVSINNILGGTTNLDHALYEGSCNGLVEVYCSNYTYNITPILTIGNEYYVRVFSAGDVASTSSFDVCVRQTPEEGICEDAKSFCVGLEGFFTENVTQTPSLGQIACLDTTSNPSWNFIQIGNSGTLHMEITQISADGYPLDVDFALWGPYLSVDQACNNIDMVYCSTCPDNSSDPSFYPFGDIVSCSYSTASVEYFSIYDAQPGEIYILLVTNYSDESGIITISQTNLDEEDAGSIVGEFEIDLGPDINICNTTESITLSAESPFGDTFEWFKDGFFIEEETNSTLTVLESGNYSVTVLNESCEAVAMDAVVVTFVDCETTGLIQVSAFVDTNNNSVIDDGEANFSNGYFTYEMNADGIVNYVTSSTGNFTIASDNETNAYDISYYFYDEYQDCYNVTTESFNDVTAVIGSEISIEFPIVDDQSCEDISVQLISNTSPRPGFSYLNYISIENLGLVETSGSIEFLMDSDLVLNTINANPNYTITQNSSGFTVDFVNLPPGFASTIVVSLTCPASVSLGQLITNTVTYTTAENDLIAENNTSTLTETVIGSYDPNDIMESHGPQIVFDEFSTSDEYLYYTIRFQNIGTAEAINVRIEDVLDSQLDETTFQTLRSSHNYVAIRMDNQLVWQFDNINLPSESMDEAASMGYVYFKIKPKPGYAIGDIIPNYADIYFDFNPPITTNTFNSEFVETLSVDEFTATQFSLIPNPADNLVTLHLKNATDGTITIFDIQGKVILSRMFSNTNNVQLDISAFESGLYFVKLKTASSETTKKLIIE